MSTDTRKRFKQLNIELVCSATGGPCEYLGRAMPQAHQAERSGTAGSAALRVSARVQHRIL